MLNLPRSKPTPLYDDVRLPFNDPVNWKLDIAEEGLQKLTSVYKQVTNLIFMSRAISFFAFSVQ